MKKKNMLRWLYHSLREKMFCVATLISPTLNTKLRYRYQFKEKLNLKTPQTFNEKLLWLKLKKYNNNPLVIQCADKYRVREYVKECGYEDILNDLLGVWDSPSEISWEELPERFVLKWNFGAGMNIICDNKSIFSRDEVVKQMKQWKKNKCWLSHSEIHYKYIPKKIVCEKFLEDLEEAVVPDYKIYCFHGKPLVILVMHNRGKGEMTIEFFDNGWRRLGNSNACRSADKITAKPTCLEKMLKTAADLSEPFPFVRCDFFVVGDRFYFGELTFTPAGGLYTFETQIDGKNMAEFLKIP